MPYHTIEIEYNKLMVKEIELHNHLSEVVAGIVGRIGGTITEGDLAEYGDFPPTPEAFEDCEALVVGVSVNESGIVVLELDNRFGNVSANELTVHDLYRLFTFLAVYEAEK